jgi:hypothetical protein
MPDFFPRDQFAGASQQHFQNLKGLILQLEMDVVLAEFSRSEVDLEGPETQNTHPLGRCFHRNEPPIETPYALGRDIEKGQTKQVRSSIKPLSSMA